jgi:hypothetical protein
MEAEGSERSSQAPCIGTYPEPEQSSPHYPILYLDEAF